MWALFCSSPGSVHGILQARILEWVAVPSSRETLQPRDWAHMRQLPKPEYSRACAQQQEKPSQWEVHTLQQRVIPTNWTGEKAHAATKTQHTQK